MDKKKTTQELLEKVKTNAGFERLKAKLTLELLEKMNPELEWKVHDNGKWYSCNDFARGGGHLLGVKLVEIQAADISALLGGIKLQAEAKYNQVARVVDEWYSIFGCESQVQKCCEPEPPKEANPGTPDITTLRKSENVSTQGFDDCRHY